MMATYYSKVMKIDKKRGKVLNYDVKICNSLK